jgi:hypothetical protein
MAPFAEVHVGLPRNLSLLKSYRLDSDARSLEEAIKLARATASPRLSITRAASK